MQFKNLEGQIVRWLEILSFYDMKTEHLPGRLHTNADGLSRRKPCNQWRHQEQCFDKEYTDK